VTRFRFVQDHQAVYPVKSGESTTRRRWSPTKASLTCPSTSPARRAPRASRDKDSQQVCPLCYLITDSAADGSPTLPSTIDSASRNDCSAPGPRPSATYSTIVDRGTTPLISSTIAAHRRRQAPTESWR